MKGEGRKGIAGDGKPGKGLGKEKE